MSTDRFSGKTAVVTGAARGIGRAIADALLAEDAKVVGVDSDWEGERESFRNAGGIAVRADFAEVDAAELGARILRDHGTIELVVNNVGITSPHGFLNLGEDDFDRVMRVNLRSPWFLTHALTSHLVANDLPGSVVFISSVHDTATRLHPHYAASKAAVVALVRELAHEVAPRGIRVNAISPGWIDTHDLESSAPEAAAEWRRVVPQGRAGRAEDIAPTALHLLDGQASAYITGVNVPVDGGLLLHSWMDDLTAKSDVGASPSAPGATAAEHDSEPASPRRASAGEVKAAIVRAIERRFGADDGPTAIAVADVLNDVRKTLDVESLHESGYPKPIMLVREALDRTDWIVSPDATEIRR
jgi:3-oxoacyl-[acyl-carrier protein] reductase